MNVGIREQRHVVIISLPALESLLNQGLNRRLKIFLLYEYIYITACSHTLLWIEWANNRALQRNIRYG